MPRKKNNISRNTKSGARPKAAAKKAAAPPPVDFKQLPAPAAVLDQPKLQQLYSSMLKCRALQRRLQEISPAGPVVAGREAVLAGALAHSRPNDRVITAQNHALAGMLRGHSLSSVLNQLTSDIARAEEAQSIPTSSGPLALIKGTEKARELVASGNSVLVFCGDDPSAPAAQREALALAAKDKAPVVCFVEVSLAALADKAEARGKRGKSSQPQFPVIAVDGADVVAVFRVAQEAIRRARTGHGPSLSKCVMPDDGRDPLQFIEQYLRRKNAWSEELQAKLADEFQRELETVLGTQR